MDDLISRQDALKALDEMSYKSPHESATSVVRKKHFGEILEKFIMQQQPAQKKGHWLYPTDVKGFCRCECCGALWGRDLYENRFFKYCPRCGADMRKEGEENG